MRLRAHAGWAEQALTFEVTRACTKAARRPADARSATCYVVGDSVQVEPDSSEHRKTLRKTLKILKIRKNINKMLVFTMNFVDFSGFSGFFSYEKAGKS